MPCAGAAVPACCHGQWADAQLRQLSLWGSLSRAQWSTLLAVCSLMVSHRAGYLGAQGPSTCCSLARKPHLPAEVEVAVTAALPLCSALLVAAAVAAGSHRLCWPCGARTVRMWLGPTTGR